MHFSTTPLHQFHQLRCGCSGPVVQVANSYMAPLDPCSRTRTANGMAKGKQCCRLYIPRALQHTYPCSEWDGKRQTVLSSVHPKRPTAPIVVLWVPWDGQTTALSHSCSDKMAAVERRRQAYSRRSGRQLGGRQHKPGSRAVVVVVALLPGPKQRPHLWRRWPQLRQFACQWTFLPCDTAICRLGP
jgi:hypothetical protein